MDSSDVIQRAGDYLRSPLPKNKDGLKEHIEKLESIRFDLAEACVDAMALLYQKRKQMLWPKDVPVGKKDPTELDRSTFLAADTSVIERDYQFLLRIEVLVKDRLEIALRLI